MELHEFLEARIAEDEAAATSALETTGGREWWAEKHYGDIFAMDLRTTDTHSDLYFEADRDENGNLSPDSYDYFHGYVAKHISRFDPSRVLAECAAKRAVLIAYSSLGPEKNDMFTEFMPQSAESGARQAFEVFLYEFADVYSTHADYNPDWAVA